jgi:hypothetical protein
MLLPNFIGNNKVETNDFLFWIAILSTFFLAYYFQKNDLRKSFLGGGFSQKTKSDGEPKYLWLINLVFLAVSIGIYASFFSGFKTPELINKINISSYWIYLSIPIITTLFQYVFQIVSGEIWSSQNLHQECWRMRFKYLSGILIILPIIIWLFVWGQNDRIFYEHLLNTICLIYMGLYLLGIIISGVNYIKKSITPWYLGFSYLCALEISPIIWTLF